MSTQFKPQQSPELNKVYTESPAVTQAKLNLESQLGQAPAGYQSNYSEGINKLLGTMNQTTQAPITNINQYRQEYMNNVNRAADETQGLADKLSGGYGNTYSKAVADQQKQMAMLDTNNINPALIQLATQANQAEINDKMRLLEAYNTQDALQYGMHRDKVADNLSEKQNLLNMYLTQQQNDRANFEADRNFTQGAFEFSEAQRQSAFEEYENRKQAQKQTVKSNELTTKARNDDNYYTEQSILKAKAEESARAAAAAIKAANENPDFVYDPDIIDPVEERFKAMVLTRSEFNRRISGKTAYNGYDTYEDYIDAKLDEFRYGEENKFKLSDNQKKRLIIHSNVN